VTDSFEIIYAAHTATCTFLLDADGMCRKIVLAPSSKRPQTAKGKDAARAAQKCVGAQYVASLDASVSGMLAEMPRIGASMLFARVDERGRVSLVRTGPVTRFEGHREDPFHGMGPKPSESVATSAPLIAPSSSQPQPRRARETMPPPEPYGERGERPTVVPKVSASEFMRISDESLADVDMPVPEFPDFDSQATARRATWPSPGATLTPPQPATLRTPTPMSMGDEDEREHDPYAAVARGVLPPPPVPRRSETYLSRPRPAGAQRPSEPAPPPLPARAPSYPPLDKVASRRRG
jgi:hypothetical protein